MTDRVDVLRRRLEVVIGTPFTEGNRIDVLRNGDQIFPAMLDAIRGAQATVDLMTFVYWQGDIARDFAIAMSERAQAGVRVRLLIDALGGRLIEKDLVDQMDRAGVQTFEQYLDVLQASADEFAALFNTILINVTAFYRDPDAWQYICDEVVPALLARRGPEEPIRLWSAGCASGQEAYTLAMVLADSRRSGTG